MTKNSELEILETLKEHFNARAKDWQGGIFSKEDNASLKVSAAKATADLADAILDISIVREDSGLLSCISKKLARYEFMGMSLLLNEQFDYCSKRIKDTDSSQATAVLGKALAKMNKVYGARTAEKPMTKTVIKYPL